MANHQSGAMAALGFALIAGAMAAGCNAGSSAPPATSSHVEPAPPLRPGWKAITRTDITLAYPPGMKATDLSNGGGLEALVADARKRYPNQPDAVDQIRKTLSDGSVKLMVASVGSPDNFTMSVSDVPADATLDEVISKNVSAFEAAFGKGNFESTKVTLPVGEAGLFKSEFPETVSILYLMLHNQKAYCFTFAVAKERKDDWLLLADACMKSVRFAP